MHGVSTVLKAMLIFIITISIIALSIPWVTETIQKSVDITEVNSIKEQFKSCNDMIIETARTGSTNKCIFSVTKGRITGDMEGIDYGIATSADICDKQTWVEIDENKHIWQKCELSGNDKIFNMKWKFPSQLEIQGETIKGNQLRGETPIANILFNDVIDFETITLYIIFDYREGESGNIVEISRVNVTAANITLNIRIS